MEIYRVSLIGHREVEHHREIEEKLMPLLGELLETKEFVEFQIGRNGEFDIFAASCIKQTQNRYGKHNSALTLVLPYPVTDLPYYEKYYDSILIPEEAERSHPKGAITKRNRWLIDNSDLLIVYARCPGGAAACLKMAEKANLRIVKI